jgi:hypothetical protein
MKTSRITIGLAVMLSFVFFGLPALCDAQSVENPDAMYSRAIDKEIEKCQAKIALKIQQCISSAGCR